MKIHFFDVNTDIYVTKEALMFQLLVQMGASSEKQEIFIQQDTLIQLMRHHDAPSVDTAQLLSTDFVKVSIPMSSSFFTSKDLAQDLDLLIQKGYLVKLYLMICNDDSCHCCLAVLPIHVA